MTQSNDDLRFEDLGLSQKPERQHGKAEDEQHREPQRQAPPQIEVLGFARKMEAAGLSRNAALLAQRTPARPASPA